MTQRSQIREVLVSWKALSTVDLISIIDLGIVALALAGRHMLQYLMGFLFW